MGEFSPEMSETNCFVDLMGYEWHTIKSADLMYAVSWTLININSHLADHNSHF